MAEYIEREALLNDIAEIHKKHSLEDGQEMLFTESDIRGLLLCIPAADVAELRPELRKALKLLEKNYERGMNSDYVRDPLAWALHQTWREINGGADNAVQDS